MNKKDIILIILNIVFISVFIGIFFFTYASKVEGVILQKQIDFLVQDFVGKEVSLLPKDVLINIRDTLKNTKLPDMSDADNKVAQNNKDLINKSIIAFSIIFIIGIAICIYLYINSDITMSEIIWILINAFIMLFVVGITEYVFLNYIAKNYYSIETNTIKRDIIDILKNIN